MTTINDIKINMRKNSNSQAGVTLLVTLLLMSVLLAVSASLMNITLKQYQLSGMTHNSEVAFQAANAGIECALYHDYVLNSFTINTQRNSINCFNLPISSGDKNGAIGIVGSGDERVYEFTWGSPAVCTEVSIYKFQDENVMVNGVETRTCPTGAVCTVVQSRGYNVACNARTSPRVVEREFTQIY